jgi:hypothetical protein
MGTNKKKRTAATDDEVDKGYETQFIPQSDDDEKLWAVEEILAEKGKKYLLRWAGTDKDGKPWPNSWVLKYDVTNDLITQWKELKQKRKLEKELKKKQRQNSARGEFAFDSDFHEYAKAGYGNAQRNVLLDHLALGRLWPRVLFRRVDVPVSPLHWNALKALKLLIRAHGLDNHRLRRVLPRENGNEPRQWW